MTGQNSVGSQTMTPISVYVVDDVAEMRDLIRFGSRTSADLRAAQGAGQPGFEPG
jgi:hypothetical protein